MEADVTDGNHNLSYPLVLSDPDPPRSPPDAGPVWSSMPACCHGGRRSRLIRIPVTALLFAGPGAYLTGSNTPNRLRRGSGFPRLVLDLHQPDPKRAQYRTGSLTRRRGQRLLRISARCLCCMLYTWESGHLPSAAGVGSFVRLSFPTELHGVAQPGVRVRRHGRAHGGAFRYVWPAEMRILQDFCVFWWVFANTPARILAPT